MVNCTHSTYFTHYKVNDTSVGTIVQQQSSVSSRPSIF